jgi:hypothetical protein
LLLATFRIGKCVIETLALLEHHVLQAAAVAAFECIFALVVAGSFGRLSDTIAIR